MRRFFIFVAAALLAGLLASGYVIWSGVSALAIMNVSETNIEIDVNAAQNRLSSRHLHGGQSVTLFFIPRKEGTISITCRNGVIVRTFQSGYVDVGMPTIYRVSIDACSSITRFDEHAIF